jgi:hypothetical protein
MPALQVKDCPSSVYDRLRLCADLEDRSISQQTLHILKQYLDIYEHSAPAINNNINRGAIQSKIASSLNFNTTNSTSGNARLDARARFLSKLTKAEVSTIPPDFPSAAELIRQDREGRIDIFNRKEIAK